VIPTSSAFQGAVLESHTVISKVEVYSDAGSFLGEIYPVDGSITIDARRGTRRAFSLSLVDYDGTMVPTGSSDLLAPYNTWLRPYRGIQFPDGSEELVPLGVYQIITTDVEADNAGVSISLQAEDLSRLMADKRWIGAKTLTQGSNVGATIAALADDLIPGQRTSYEATDYKLPTGGAISLGKGLTQNPWEDLQLLAQSIGQEIFFDATGVLRSEAHPILRTGGALGIYGPGSTLLGARRSFTVDGIYNRVIVTGEGSQGSGFSGSASDSVSGSPTAVASIGERAISISSPLIDSTARAGVVAELLLRQYVGQPISFSIVCNPALEPRDFVRVQDDRIGLDAVVVIDALDISLDGGEMQIQGRAVS
jgi:hypothetical protein